MLIILRLVYKLSAICYHSTCVHMIHLPPQKQSEQQWVYIYIYRHRHINIKCICCRNWKILILLYCNPSCVYVYSYTQVAILTATFQRRYDRKSSHTQYSVRVWGMQSMTELTLPILWKQIVWKLSMTVVL